MFASRLSFSQLSKNDAFPALKENARSTLYLRCGFPGRIAFKVAFEEDSRMIIGENGADRLNGKGDFLFRDSTGLHRGQVPYISDEDFESLCAR